MAKRKTKRKKTKRYRSNPAPLSRAELMAKLYTARNNVHEFSFYVEGMMDAGVVPPFSEHDLHTIADCFIDLQDRIQGCRTKLGI